MQQKKRLGEIFVELGIISQKTVERILARAERSDKRFGTFLEEMELVTGEEMAKALALQYNCKVATNLGSLKIPSELLKLVPINVAMTHHILPLKQDKGHMALAMADPSDMKLVDMLAANTNHKIVRFVAAKNEIYAAISKHYLGTVPIEQSKPTVLIAEDDKGILTMLHNMLVKAGYQVVTACDGMEAFKAAVSKMPHVIITDKEMPKLGGYGLLEALKNIQETSNVPVIMITENTMNAEEEANAFEKGFFDFIAKPLKEMAILPRVKRAFHFYDHQYRL